MGQKRVSAALARLMLRSAAIAAVLASIPFAPAPAAETPDSVMEAVQVVGLVRAAATAVPVLTGAEGFDVEAFRTALRAGREGVPYTRFLTARDVTDLVAGGATYSAQLTYLEIGWAALEVNWVYATLLGDAEVAAGIEEERVWLLTNHPLYIANVTSPPEGAVFASFYTRLEASRLSMLLRQNAAQANLGTYIPDAIDPEGFVRQRLLGVYRRLVNSADLIRDAGEAFSPF